MIGMELLPTSILSFRLRFNPFDLLACIVVFGLSFRELIHNFC